MKHWSSTQSSIALSSGEVEFAGVIRGAGQGLGYQALLKDLGVALPLRVWTDSSAAIGICSRQGLGKLRHLDTHTLWIQQAVRTGRVDLRKVPGEQNPADLLTKHSNSRQRLEELVKLFGCKYLGGRAASAPQVRKGESSRVTMAQADLNTLDGSGQHPSDDDEGPPPIMPHLTCSATMLDQLFPSVEAPDDEQLDDLNADETDGTLKHGMRIAEKIVEENALNGRRRRPADEPTPTPATATTPATTTHASTATTTATTATTTGATRPTAPPRSTPGTTPRPTAPAATSAPATPTASSSRTAASTTTAPAATEQQDRRERLSVVRLSEKPSQEECVTGSRSAAISRTKPPRA